MGKKLRLTSSILRGAEGFDAHFATAFGEAWPALRARLCESPAKVALLNPFADEGVRRPLLDAGRIMSFAALTAVEGIAHLQPTQDSRGLLSHYFIDSASLEVVAELAAAQKILDLCAAPGGKALALIFSQPEATQFFLNDLSNARSDRLRKVIHLYVPPLVQTKVRFSRRDGALLFRSAPESCDLILVDAPCSGERHLLSDPEELSHWSVQRGRRLAHRQVALLCSAVEMLVGGGSLVYSTCSIDRAQNDGVVERLLDKWAPQISLQESKWLLPTADNNRGPIFFARFTKAVG
jgi:hypothetical protein